MSKTSCVLSALCLSVLGTGIVFVGCSGPNASTITKEREGVDFKTRCESPEVVRCVGFDSQEVMEPYIHPPWGEKTKRGIVVTDVKASGTGSLRFEVPSNSGDDSSGSFKLNFADDLSIQFGEGDEFYVQWRQRFSPEFLNTFYEGGYGWKQLTIGEGDRPGSFAPGCTQLEIVVQNTSQIGFAQLYHSCGGKDGLFENLGGGGPKYVANEWMTFQVHVKIGTWYKNDRDYHGDSTVQFWVAREGRPSDLAINLSPEPVSVFGLKIPGTGYGYDLANNNPMAKYGKLILSPYHTGKSQAQNHHTGYVWYDELIISTSKIQDPQ